MIKNIYKFIIIFNILCILIFNSSRIFAADIKKQGDELINDSVWQKKEPVSPKLYQYTIAVIGDTQNIIGNSDKYKAMYQWLASNTKNNKIKFVIGLGDITGQNADVEWGTARDGISLLDDIIPYSLVNGNHDYSNGKEPTNLNKYFPFNKYSSQKWFGGAYEIGSLDNAWYKLDVGYTKYLILALEFGPTNDVIDWASGVIRDNSDYNVIITTHSYLEQDGTTKIIQGLPSSYYNDANDGDVLWNNLISKYNNISLVLCGHVISDKIVIAQQSGINKNTVTQILCNPQGVDSVYSGTGLVLLLHFSNGGSTVTTEYYSTIRDEYFLEENQTTFNINIVGKQNYDETSEQTSNYETEVQVETNTVLNESESIPIGTNYFLESDISATQPNESLSSNTTKENETTNNTNNNGCKSFISVRLLSIIFIIYGYWVLMRKNIWANT